MAYFAPSVGHVFWHAAPTDTVAPPLANFLLGTFVSSRPATGGEWLFFEII